MIDTFPAENRKLIKKNKSNDYRPDCPECNGKLDANMIPIQDKFIKKFWQCDKCKIKFTWITKKRAK